MDQPIHKVYIIVKLILLIQAEKPWHFLVPSGLEGHVSTGVAAEEH